MRNNRNTCTRAMALVGTTLALTGASLAFASGVASAHYSTVTASIDCSGYVQWTAAPYMKEAAAGNERVIVEYELGVTDGSGSGTLVGVGSFALGEDGLPNGFSGSFAWPASNPAAITIQAHEVGAWSDGTPADPWDPTTVLYRPEVCPSFPAAGAKVECAAGSADVVVTLSNNSGPLGRDVSFTVTDPTTGGTIARLVPTMTSVDVVFRGVPASTTSIGYSVAEQPGSIAIDIDCAVPVTTTPTTTPATTVPPTTTPATTVPPTTPTTPTTAAPTTSVAAAGPTTSVAAAAPTTSVAAAGPTTTAAPGSLPVTGSSSLVGITFGAGLLLLGAATVRIARREPSATV